MCQRFVLKWIFIEHFPHAGHGVKHFVYYEILQLSLGQRGLFLDSFCKGHKGSAVLFNNKHLAPEAY